MIVTAARVSVFQGDVAHGSQWNGGSYAQPLEPQAAARRNFGSRTRPAKYLVRDFEL
jgi:hypothetical protein